MANLPAIPAGTLVKIDGVALLADAQTVVNLTGKTLEFTAKRRSTDADADALIHKTSAVGEGIDITDAPNGEFTVTLDPADTDAFNQYTEYKLEYDIMLIDGVNPYQLVRGILTLLGSVTHDPG